MKICSRIIFCVCALAAAALFSLSACASADRIRTLEALVSGGVIGEEDLRHIAALRNGSLQVVTEDGAEPETIEYTVAPVTEELSEKQKNTILKDFEKYIEDRYRAAHVDCTVTESEIVAYFGTYGGWIVVEVEFDLSGIEVSEGERDLIVSDYYLGQIGWNGLVVGWAES